MVRLLTGGSIYELAERAPTGVAFQQAPATTVDDLVLTAGAADGVSTVRLEVAVRRTPRFITSDQKTKELIVALVKADLAAERASDPLVEIRLAIAVAGKQTHAEEVAHLAVIARGQSCAEGFFDLVNTPGKFAARGRLGHLRNMVAEALAGLEDSEANGTAEHRCWSLLTRLWIIQLDLEGGAHGDWTALIDELKPVALEHSRESAVALRDRLEQLSGEFARGAGVVDVSLLRRRLHGEIDPDAHVAPPGWTRLLRLDKEARSAVSRTLSGTGTALDFTLTRQAVRDELRATILAPGHLVVKGDSGVGKSALVMDAIEPGELDAEVQAIALNLRHLPVGPLELLALLSDPIDTLLGELTAPVRILVIDGAEAAAEAHGPVFSHVLHSAREAGLKVIAVAATEGAGTASELVKASLNATGEYTVPGLTDDEIAAAAEHFPGLQRLAGDPRARELLRRPIVIDLLARLGDPGLPLSESDALNHIWQHLVRNNGRRNAGTPDAREQVMLRLAAHALRKGDIEDLLAHLDIPAVEGLRRSGLILRASELPWERVPEFKHDLLRAYSIARYLLRERDPAAALMSYGAPRWILPSARLACEIVLSAPDQPSDPLAGRFGRLQTTFEAIAASGRGERWADVPTEALLVTPNSLPLLIDAWPTLLRHEAHGLARVIRALHGRHQRGGLLDPIIAEPVIVRLLEDMAPRDLAKEVGGLIRDWLMAHVLRLTAAGQPTRVAVREAIVEQCAEKERALDKQVAARQAALAARTPEEVAEDEERANRFAAGAPSPERRRRRPVLTRHPPYQWIEDAQIEQLALLGADLGERGEAILRRIAEDRPHSLEHAVEAPFGGHSLAAYDSKLLIDLAVAYYIEDEDEDEDEDDDYGWSSGLREEGIRHHRFSGLGALASFTHGPFIAIFRADYLGGVAFINRMLNHAARCRVRILSSYRSGLPAERKGEGMQYTLAIAGEPQTYIGDNHVWLWYRGTGVGPYPCMSALQALEFVTEEHLRAGATLETLTSIMLKGAKNLAMPALALGILVRHLETAGSALDPYLVETQVWELEFSRAVNDQVGGLAARIPELDHPERRGWNLLQVSMTLMMQAEGERVQHLKEVGKRLLANARAQLEDVTSPGGRKHLAAVHTWAASLDRDAYEVEHRDGQVVIQQVANPEVEQILGEINADLGRQGNAVGLTVRHAHVRDNGGRAPDMTDEALAADLAMATDLLDNPPLSGLATSRDGPVAVAASAIELHLSGRAVVSDADLRWCGAVLMRVGGSIAERPSDPFDVSLFSEVADRSAARALPYLLLPAAVDLRRTLGVGDPSGIDTLISLSAAVASHATNEARLAYARGLDAVWAAPCDEDHLHGRCHHVIALELVTESFLACAMGARVGQAERSVARLDPPVAASLDGLDGKDILLQRLTAATRACGSAAIRNVCCKVEVTQTAESLTAAHQRAMRSMKHGLQHSHSYSLVAARTALWQAIDGRDEPVLAYVDRYLGHPRLLAEGLQAIATAGEERADAGAQGRRLWPQIMERVLDAAKIDPRLFNERTWGDCVEADLIPNPSAQHGAYLTLELAGEPNRWRDLLGWSPQVERWLGAIRGVPKSIDHLIIAIRELDTPDQVETGLKWVEQIVGQSGSSCANTYTLPEWLHHRRADLMTEAQTARWQRIVDLLVIAGDERIADLAD